MADNTRIFITGLPPSFTDDELRRHFSSRSYVTDAHVIPKRKIGFVGFKSNAAALDAVKYFNRSYIRMSKIAVEIARPVGATPTPTACKEHPNGNVHSATSFSLKRKRGQEDDHLKLREFLATMKPTTSRTWGDDAGLDGDANLTQDEENKTQHDDDNELTYAQKKKLKQGGLSESQHLTHLSENLSLEEMQAEAQGNYPMASQSGPTSDADWLRSKTSRLLGLVDDEEIPRPVQEYESEDSDNESRTKHVGNQEQQDNPESEVEGEVDTNIDMIRNTGRLFVRNLSYEITESDLDSLFSPFGKIEEIHIAFDTRYIRSKGFAYVQYVQPESAIAAYRELDGKDFQGRLLHVLPASAKKTYKLDEFEISKLPLKKRQQLKRRAEATSATFSWNSLYMNVDAVMASVAARLGVPKSQLLDPTSSDSAVKQAHAETHIIQETKAYFAANGVSLDSFKQRERGNTAILVKNFSWGVKAEDLRTLFEPFGNIKRLLMPPTGTIAIVEFGMPDEAQRAFKSLAYKKLGDSILFLEKAPKDLFDCRVVATAISNPQPANDFSQSFSISDTFNAVEDNESVGQTSTLFVRNLNFSTTSAGLAEVFKPLQGFMSAIVRTKPNPKKPGETLSMGFGFVEFRNSIFAQKALATMHGYKLDNHNLVIKASQKAMDVAEERRNEDKARKSAARGTKLVIKNLPFEVTKKDIRSLFAGYGKLRSVRLPQKFDRTARGFAFADFVSTREAENAMGALKDTHLLGRRLVIDFASEEAEDPETELRRLEKKVGAQVDRVQINQLVSGGRRKFQLASEAGDE